MRIGIDVGGTHTDAVILDDARVIAATKVLTTADVASGVENALDVILADGSVEQDCIEQVMIGTTQFTNAIIERRELTPTAAIRIALPSGDGMPPMFDWPDDIADALGRHAFMLSGGSLYDGRQLAPLDDSEIENVIKQLVKRNIRNIAIAAAFSPMNPAPEEYVAQKIQRAIPDARMTLSHHFGRLGLIERENAAVLNTSLLSFAERVVASFLTAVGRRGLTCPVYISQNDGTLMSADFVREFPALTFASGPTNSSRGACKLTGLKDAVVVDIGGTTSDIGVLKNGFPRESNVVVDIGGVRTNFRMPDVLSIGMGGGSLVNDDGSIIGPRSVGHRLVSEGLVFGGSTLTTTDILVASGGAEIGDSATVNGLSPDLVDNAQATIHGMLDRAIESMKPSSAPMPVILVGGGAILVSGDLQATSELHRPENADVANAIGAAIAQIGAEVERLVSYRSISRDDAIRELKAEAVDRAEAAGANRDSIRTVDIEETSIPYMDEAATRIRVKVIGDIAATAARKRAAG